VTDAGTRKTAARCYREGMAAKGALVGALAMIVACGHTASDGTSTKADASDGPACLGQENANPSSGQECETYNPVRGARASETSRLVSVTWARTRTPSPSMGVRVVRPPRSRIAHAAMMLRPNSSP